MPKTPKPQGLKCLLIFIIIVFIKMDAFGQCNIPVRSFATIQRTNVDGLLSSVSNASNAVNGNMIDSSRLNSGVLGTAIQLLDFGTTQTAGTPVTVKLSFPAGLLSLLGGVKVQPYTNLHNTVFGWTGDAAGKAYTNATLLGLLNGAGDMEITIVPQTAGGVTVPFTGVWIELSGLSVAQHVDVYGAFVNTTGGASVACNTPIDVLSGIRTTVVGGIATATGDVDNQWDAIDNNETTTFAELKVGAEVLSQVFHTTIFNSQSQLGDKVRLVLQKPGGGLLDLSLLSEFTIQLYNGTTAVGLPVKASSGLLSVSLLPGNAGEERYEVIMAPPNSYGVFDRVDVQVGGVATVGLVQGLRIYDVKRLIASPTTNINAVAATSISVCEGNSAALTVNNPQSCTTYKWYDAAVGGNLLQTGLSYTPTVASLSTSAANVYYIQATRDNCTETATRTAVTINVNPKPTVAPGTAVPVCTGVTTTTVPYTGTNTPTTYNIVWDAAAITAGFLNVPDTALPASNLNVTLPGLAAAGTYNGTITVKNANCTGAGTPFSVKIDARPAQPTIALTN